MTESDDTLNLINTTNSPTQLMDSFTNSTTLQPLTTTENTTDPEECPWCLDENLIGGLISFFISVECLLSFIANSFIILHTIYHAKSLRQSSTLLLFNLALINLIMTVLFMPFAIIASAAEEWIFGSTDRARDVLCQITAFIFAYTVSISVHTLAAISFDRFLLIVKPYWHKRFMTWKTALGIVIFLWLYSILIDSTPFYGLGDYAFAKSVGACVPLWTNNRDYIIFFSVLSLIPLTTIVVTTTWTYIFTRRFIRKDFQRRKTTVSKERLETEKSIYNVRIRNLIGIFGALLLFNILTLSPFITASIVGLIVGPENVPVEVYATVFVLFLLSNVTNSILQAYFRRELRATIMKYTMKVLVLLRCKQIVMLCCPCLKEKMIAKGDENSSPRHHGDNGDAPGIRASLDDNGDSHGDVMDGNILSKNCCTEMTLGSMDLHLDVASENGVPLPNGDIETVSSKDSDLNV